MTHFVVLAAGVYQWYSLRMALAGFKHVAVTYSVNKVEFEYYMSAFVGIYLIVILVHGYEQDNVIFCYCSHALAVPLVSGVFYLEIYFVCWLWVIKESS
jgi:hypothetical protein